MKMEEYSLKTRIIGFIIACRLFALPWVFSNTLFAVALAGFNLHSFFLAFSITTLVMIGTHHLNNLRDFQKGLDKVEGGSKKKSYTSASKILPAGILSVETEIVASIVFFTVPVVLFYFFAPINVYTVLFLLCGEVVGLSYTDGFKEFGLNEIGGFLAQGFLTVLFAYSLIKPPTLEAITAGIIAGMLSATVFFFDKYKDIGSTDLEQRANSLAKLAFNADIRPNWMWFFFYSSTVTITIVSVLFGFLPMIVLSAVVTFPLSHLTGMFLEVDYDKGILLGLIVIWLYVLIPAVLIIGQGVTFLNWNLFS